MPLPSQSLCCLWRHRPQHLNHSPLILFGIHGSVLCWVKSYLLSRSFRVKCNNNFSSFHTSACVRTVFLKPLFSALHHVHYPSQYSDLFPFPWPVWPPPLCRWNSALILFPPTQLWLKHFSPSKRSSTDLFLSANLLTLNASKTEFLLIGLKNQLSKIHNSSLNTSHSDRNLGFIFDEHLTFLTKLHLSPKPVTITFVNFAVSSFTSICQLPVTLQPLSFTSSLITVILCNVNSLTLKYSVSSRSRTLLLVLSLKLLSLVISLPSCALSTGSESLNASNTSSSHLPTKFSQLPNLHTFITSSLLIVLEVLALHPSLLLLGHRHHPLYKITDRSFLYASPCLWNQLPLSLRHPHSGTSSSISDSPIPSPITSSSFDSPLCSSITPSKNLLVSQILPP